MIIRFIWSRELIDHHVCGIWKDADREFFFRDYEYVVNKRYKHITILPNTVHILMFGTHFNQSFACKQEL